MPDPKPLSTFSVPEVTAYGEPLTSSPASRASAESVVVTLPVSFTDTGVGLFQVVTDRFTTPLSVNEGSAGSSVPYTFVWFGLVMVAVSGACVTARFGVFVKFIYPVLL